MLKEGKKYCNLLFPDYCGFSERGSVTSVIAFTRGIRSGVSSNSAHPPRKPTSTIRPKTLLSSSFLEKSIVMMETTRFNIILVQSFVRKRVKLFVFYLSLSACHCSLNCVCMSSTVFDSSEIRFERSSIWSSTRSRRLDWLLELRQLSPIIRTAATAKRKPSAIASAPLSMALFKNRDRDGEMIWGEVFPPMG